MSSTIMGTFLAILNQNLAMSWSLAISVWLIYCATIYAASPTVPMITILISRGTRATIFEYAWCYMSFTHFHQAFIYGIPWTFRYASLLSRASITARTKWWQRFWIYTTNMAKLGVGLIIQPVLFFYITREMGKSPLFGGRGAESSLYAGLFLHTLRIVFETIEQVTYDRFRIDLRLTIFFLIGIAIAILQRKGYMETAAAKPNQFWQYSKAYLTLITIASRSLHKKILHYAQAKMPAGTLHGIRMRVIHTMEKVQGLTTLGGGGTRSTY